MKTFNFIKNKPVRDNTSSPNSNISFLKRYNHSQKDRLATTFSNPYKMKMKCNNELEKNNSSKCSDFIKNRSNRKLSAFVKHNR